MKSPLYSLTVLVAALALSATGCGNGHKNYPAPDSVHVADIYSVMYRYGRTDSAGRAALAVTDTAQLHAFMSVVAETPVTDMRLQAWSWALPVLVFTPAVDSIYHNGTDSVAIALGNIQARMRANDIELKPRLYAAVVWGRNESVMFVDSVMLIALNHYLGAEYDGYSHFPLYMRLVKEPRLMPYDLAEAIIATDHPYQPQAGTALERMLYEGALTAAKIEAVDGGNVADALGYRPEQIEFIQQNEQQLWRTLVEREFLYDTSVTTIDKLVAPGPNTSLLDVRCPGRAGRYIGYRIVREYMDRHPETSLAWLLSSQFYAASDILAQSGYNP